MNAFDEVEGFRAAIGPNGRLLGLDLGSKTIGLALSDPLRMVATPMQVIRRSKFAKDAATLKALTEEHRITGYVLGLPRNMDGSEGPRCQSTRAFARNLNGAIDLPILFFDERWSTLAAERAMLEADTSRAKRANRIDQVAAGLILQGALDRLRT
ncbi:MAG: Holliday junction resolvase RuvX [Pseudomonadota bacterium]